MLKENLTGNLRTIDDPTLKEDIPLKHKTPHSFRDTGYENQSVHDSLFDRSEGFIILSVL
jgi:hypothetical protein